MLDCLVASLMYLSQIRNVYLIASIWYYDWMKLVLSITLFNAHNIHSNTSLKITLYYAICDGLWPIHLLCFYVYSDLKFSMKCIFVKSIQSQYHITSFQNILFVFTASYQWLIGLLPTSEKPIPDYTRQDKW